MAVWPMQGAILFRAVTADDEGDDCDFLGRSVIQGDRDLVLRMGRFWDQPSAAVGVFLEFLDRRLYEAVGLAAGYDNALTVLGLNIDINEPHAYKDRTLRVKEVHGRTADLDTVPLDATISRVLRRLDRVPVIAVPFHRFHPCSSLDGASNGDRFKGSGGSGNQIR